MITKQLGRYIGYGNTNDEALLDCQIISLFDNVNNMVGNSKLEHMYKELSPWTPKNKDLHINRFGYIRISDNNSMLINDSEVSISTSIYEIIYNHFRRYLKPIEFALCSKSIQNFLNVNNTATTPINKYPFIIPEFFDETDKNVNTLVRTKDYNILFWNTGKVGLKRVSEEMYWTCMSDSDILTKDLLYYIGYIKNYDYINEVI